MVVVVGWGMVIWIREIRGGKKGHAFSLDIDINALVFCDGVLAVDAFIANIVGMG